MTNKRSTAQRKGFIIATFLVAMCLAPSADAGWQELKPIFGGGAQRIVVDAGGTIYVSGSGGLFKSADGGNTWTGALGNLPTTQVGTIVPDPVNVGIVYVWTDEGLYRTMDGANTWTRLPLNLPTGVSVTEMAVAPSDPNALFVATWGSYAWRSLDRGATWQQSSSGLYGGWSGPAYLTSMNVDPTNRNRVYTSTWRGRLFRSDNAGASWYQVADSGTWANSQIHVSRSSPNVLYTRHDKYWFGRDNILRSNDYGNTWVAAGQPTAHRSGTSSVAVDPSDADVVYAVSGEGLYKTVDGGMTWQLAFAPPAGPAGMTAAAVEPSDPSRVYAGSAHFGFYRSLDGGTSWSQHNNGLSMAQVRGIEICRDAPSTVYVGAAGEGFSKSTDGGMTWSLIGTAQGLQNHAVYGLGGHPGDPDTVLISTVEGSTPRIWRSTDGGSSFSIVAGYGSATLQFNPQAPNYVHVRLGDSLGAFLRSTDGGVHWNVPQRWYRYPTDFAFHPSYPNVLVNAVKRYTGSARNLLTIMYSNNYGTSWSETPALGWGEFTDSALDPTDPTTLLVAGYMPSEASRGVYKFNVGYSGSSVVSISRVPGTFNNGLATETVRRLLADPTTGDVYASTPLGVFRSTDQAASWSSINDGLPYLSTDVMALSPDGTRLFVGTSGGVWEFSDALPVGVATPTLTTVPPDLLIESVAGLPMPPLAVTAASTTASDVLVMTTTTLPLNMTFQATDGNPATGSLDFSPAGNQRGLSYAIEFLATSTLDPAKSATLTRYVTVLGDSATDASALIAANSAGSITTPDGLFTLHLAAGSIPATDPYTVVNVIQRTQLKQADARMAGGKAKIVNGYDIDVGNQEHFTFALPVALTFNVEAGLVQDLADVEIYAYNEATDLWELRNDTSCLAGFNLQPTTGDAVTGGTVSVCTTTLSTWATVDMGTFVSQQPPVAACTDVTVAADALCQAFVEPSLVDDGSMDPDGESVTLALDPPGPFDLGVTPVTLRVTDEDGLEATCDAAVTAALAFEGFFAPLGGADATGGTFDEPVGQFKLGRTLPVKFRVACDTEVYQDGRHTLQAVHWPNADEADPPVDAVSTDREAEGNVFRRTGQTWHFNLDTGATDMHPGRWQLVATLADGTRHAVWIRLR